MSSQEDAIIESLNASYFDVLFKYLKSPVLVLVFLIGIITVFALYQNIVRRRLKDNAEINEDFLISVIICWVGFLAPLSWIILAKGHSYIHVSINLLLWNVPYTICAINCIVIFIKNIARNFKTSFTTIVCCCLCVSFVGAFAIQVYTIYEYNHPLKTALYQTIYYAEGMINGSLTMDIYVNFYDGNMAYIDARGSTLALLNMNGTKVYIDGVSYDYSTTAFSVAIQWNF